MKSTRIIALINLVVLISLLMLSATGAALEAQPEQVYPCRFYSSPDELVDCVNVPAGESIALADAPVPPYKEGMRFVYWYPVDALLRGEAHREYSFGTPVREPVYLMALYTEVPEASPSPEAVDPAQEEPAAVPDVGEAPETAEAEEPAVPEAGGEAEAASPEESAAPEETAQPEASESSETPAAPEAGEEAEAASPEESVAPEETAQPEASESSETPAAPEAGEEAADAENQLTEEELGILLAEQVDQLCPERFVQIYLHWGDKETIYFGDTLYFTAKLIGYESLSYELRWQYLDNPDEIWQDIPDQTEERMELVLDEANILWSVRLQVHIIGINP